MQWVRVNNIHLFSPKDITEIYVKGDKTFVLLVNKKTYECNVDIIEMSKRMMI